MFATQPVELGSFVLEYRVNSNHWKNAGPDTTQRERVHFCLNLNGGNVTGGEHVKIHVS